jgi:hypothetical protein
MTDKYAIATTATQEVLLDAASDSELGVEGFQDKLSLDTSNWLDEPVISYYDFMRACGLLGLSAATVFKRTKDKAKEKVAALKSNATNAVGNAGSEYNTSNLPPLNDVEVDSAAAGMGAADDVLLRWSDIREAMASKTGKTVEQVSQLFDGMPSKVSENEISLVLRNNNSRTQVMVSKLLNSAFKQAGIVNADKLVISFVDA